MKSIALWLAAAFCCGVVQAQVPHQFNYQGYLTGPGGTPVNTSVQMLVNLYGVPAGGVALHGESQTVAVTNGVFNVLIGGQPANPLTLPFDVPYWLGVKVEADAEMTPRQPVAASAYAISAARAEALAATATVSGSQVSGSITTATLPAGNLTGPIAGSQLASGLTLGGTTAGTFSGPLTGDVIGNVSGSAASFTGALAGDVTGTQSATLVSEVGGTTAANVATGASLANAATSASTANTIVKRDASGDFAAGAITATLTGNAATATKLATPRNINGVAFDGTTDITLLPYQQNLPGPGAASVLDRTGIVGLYTSIVIGADGLGLISYHDLTNTGIKVLHCGNLACNGGNSLRYVNQGQTSAIAIGADGLGKIWYGDNAGMLRVVHCLNSTCDESYADGAFTGTAPSATTGPDGRMLVSYYDQVNSDLKLLRCDHITCLQVDNLHAPITLDAAGDVGRYSSITIGQDGFGLISYLDYTNASLKVLHCGNALCNSGNTITSVDATGQPGSNTSIVLGADGLGVIAYYDVANSALKVLHCGNLTCNSGNTITQVDGTGNVGINASIAIGADGLAMISYYDVTNGNLKALHCGNVVCNSGNLATTLDMPDDAWNGSDDGAYTSIAKGADGLMLISYYSASASALKAYHCSNVTCAAYVRVGR